MSSHPPLMLCRPAIVSILFCLFWAGLSYMVYCVLLFPVESPAWVSVRHVCSVCGGD